MKDGNKGPIEGAESRIFGKTPVKSGTELKGTLPNAGSRIFGGDKPAASLTSLKDIAKHKGPVVQKTGPAKGPGGMG